MAFIYKYTHTQEAAFNFLEQTPRAGLFLEPANGKTRVCIDFVKKYELKTLVISSGLILSNTWPDEIRKWNANPKLFRFCLASYAQLPKETEPIDLLILDESTLFKNHRARRYKELIALINRLKPKRLIILTGTPHPQSFTELWAQIFLLDGGKALGRYAQYINNYFCQKAHPWEELKLKPGADAEIYNAIDHLVCVSETPKSILPHASYKTRSYTPSEKTQELITYIKENGCLPTPEGVDPEDLDFDTMDSLMVRNAYITLRKTIQMDTTRVYHLSSLLDKFNKTIVYTYFRDERDLLLDSINTFTSYKGNKRLFSFGGQDSLEKRQEIIKAFCEAPEGHLIVPYSLVSHGLNLQKAADTIIWYTLPDSLEAYLQANRRIIRPGGFKQVNIIHIKNQFCLDELIYARLKKREAVQLNLFEFFKK